MNRFVRFILLGACIARPARLPAQNITGSIVGTVTDASGPLVPGTEITVGNTGTGQVFQATADATSTYSVTNLLAGAYEVTATSSAATATRGTSRSGGSTRFEGGARTPAPL